MHEIFKSKLTTWLDKHKGKKRVVISHHAPTKNPNTKYQNNKLQHAFNSLDMEKIIAKYQPNLWIYGHTHECDKHKIGKTQIISNQLGYPQRDGSFECTEFDKNGLKINL
jgi:Icc-related predicted phosphoesterase